MIPIILVFFVSRPCWFPSYTVSYDYCIIIFTIYDYCIIYTPRFLLFVPYHVGVLEDVLWRHTGSLIHWVWSSQLANASWIQCVPLPITYTQHTSRHHRDRSSIIRSSSPCPAQLTRCDLCTLIFYPPSSSTLASPQAGRRSPRLNDPGCTIPRPHLGGTFKNSRSTGGIGTKLRRDF